MDMMETNAMASTQTDIDCFHDIGNEDDTSIIDAEWNKLKSSHTKEGYRDGYSAGEEAVLQDAFNTGFTHQVNLETCAAFYKGILWALKTLSEQSRASRGSPKVCLNAPDILKIELQLEELNSIVRGSDLMDKMNMPPAKETHGKVTRECTSEKADLELNAGDDGQSYSRECLQSTCTCTSVGQHVNVKTAHSLGFQDLSIQPSSVRVSEGPHAIENTTIKQSFQFGDLEKKTESVPSFCHSAGQVISQNQENEITGDEAACCSTSKGICQSVVSEGDPLYGTTSEPSSVRKFKEERFEIDGSNTKVKKIVGNCQNLLKELGIGDTCMLQLHPFGEYLMH
ncbi:uncharacterized protein LOC110983802 [Acanthaster planci]|uniref:Uncharacterized protein LOC110983802 n=1 Tax=Acanthaster planci TaxID=133434 RepID=A0A8B7Z0D3_ACAPL|nr:uncharacterized protein LOC110983802 [Acanthaster planci]